MNMLRHRGAGLPALAALAILGACAGSQPERPAPPPSAPTHQPPYAGAPGTEPLVPHQDDPWPVKTRYVVDLWLHGFALISDDTARVPLFRRGYRDEMVVEKNKRRITTALDTKHDSLATFLAAHPILTGAQFLALYEHSWDVMQRDIKVFLTADGNPRKVQDKNDQQMIYTFSQVFPGAGDRKWLAMFAVALQDESMKFYESYWNHVQVARRPVLAAVDTAWSKAWEKRLRRFQNSAAQERGDIYLSLPLGAEGRTILGGKRQNVIAVTYPGTPDSAAEAIYVIAHEAVGNLAGTAVGDNTTPSEKRAGLADRYLSAATVRGGALLIQRVAPDQMAGYQGFYLRAVGVTYTPGQEALAFRTAFELPDAILEAMRQALDATTTGI